MKVAMYYSNSDVRITKMPVPEIGDDELLVKVKACGICGSDVMEWYRIQKAPLVLGHEVSGEIAKVGDGIKQSEEVRNYSVGDRVSVTHHVPCNTCHYCLSGHHSVCETLRTTTFFPGGFSEYLRVPKINVDRGIFPLPDEMSHEEAVFIEPLGCVFRGQRLAGFKPGMSVLIIGSGVTGLLFVKLLLALGAGRIITTDISDFKLQKAMEMGADAVISANKNVQERVKELNNGRLADLVISTAGASAAIKTAIDSVDRGGTILFFAPSRPGEMVEIPLAKLWKDEVKIVTCYASSPLDSNQAIELIRSGRVKVKDMISHVLPLEKAGEGFALAADSTESLKVIIKP